MFWFFTNKGFFNRLPKMIYIDINLITLKIKKTIIKVYQENKYLKYFKKYYKS